MGLLDAFKLVAVVCAVTLPGCRRSSHAHLPTYSPPPVPAGFVEHVGAGWRVAVPSTWKEAGARGPAALALADPQSVDDYRANASVVTEAWTDESFDYAKASELALRREPRATVETTREEVVDGDPTLVIESHWAPASPSTVVYRTMQSALASRGAGYVVTCSVAAGAFERYRSTCESILRSFAVER
jgi:hypothetical protein